MRSRNDGTTPPISGLMKPMYVLQMNWPRWSDENRLKWLRELSGALTETERKVRREIVRLDQAIKTRAGWSGSLCPLEHHRGVKCANEARGCSW